MTLKRQDKLGRSYKPFEEPGKGIAMTNRSAFPDSEKWSAREHVPSELEAAGKLKAGWRIWMERVDGTSKRPSLIRPASVEGWR